MNSCKSTIAVKCLFPDTFRYRTFDNGELDDVFLRVVDDDEEEEEEEERAGKNRTAPRNAFWLISTTTRFLPIPTFKKDAQKLRGNFRKPSEASCKRATPGGHFVVVVVVVVEFSSSTSRGAIASSVLSSRSRGRLFLSFLVFFFASVTTTTIRLDARCCLGCHSSSRLSRAPRHIIRACTLQYSTKKNARLFVGGESAKARALCNTCIIYLH